MDILQDLQGRLQTQEIRTLCQRPTPRNLENEGYYEAATNPSLWRHTWRPIMFRLIVDDFGVEYGVK